MRELTLILPFYRNVRMLQQQQAIWAAYPEDIKAHLHVIVVDDCSPPKHRASAVFAMTGVASCRLYRIEQKKRWNWLICRNLGVDQADTEWVLLTDMDHVVPAETWRSVMTQPLDDSLAYRFGRVDAPGITTAKSHPNTWLMTKALYDRVGGYDERLSGFYGTDADFRERVTDQARAIQIRTEVVIRYSSESIADAETTDYARKSAEDRGLEVAKLARRRELDQPWRPKRLLLPWTHQLTFVEEGEAVHG